jgi:hypothetical protein
VGLGAAVTAALTTGELFWLLAGFSLTTIAFAFWLIFSDPIPRPAQPALSSDADPTTKGDLGSRPPKGANPGVRALGAGGEATRFGIGVVDDDCARPSPTATVERKMARRMAYLTSSATRR